MHLSEKRTESEGRMRSLSLLRENPWVGRLFLTAPEAGRPRSGCWQVGAPGEASLSGLQTGAFPPWPHVASPVCLCECVCVCVQTESSRVSPRKDTCPIRPKPLCYDLRSQISTKTLSPNTHGGLRAST